LDKYRARSSKDDWLFSNDSYNVDFPLTFHVVPSEALNVDVILSTDLINQAEVKINKDDLTITKPSASIFLSQIELQPENEAICINVIIDKEVRNIAENIMMYNDEI